MKAGGAWTTSRAARASQASGCDTVEIASRHEPIVVVEPPDLPELERRPVQDLVVSGHLLFDGALVEDDRQQPVSADQIVVTESELRGVQIDAPAAPGLRLRDVVLRGCDLSNADGREGSLRRVEIHDSRLMGFGLAGGDVQDLRVLDSSLALGTLAFSRLKDVIFERVDLTETSFMQAQLERVAFIDCRLAGTDFRAAKLNGCTIRGTSLEGVIGIESLRGVSMRWVDVLESAGALAAALGIHIDES